MSLNANPAGSLGNGRKVVAEKEKPEVLATTTGCLWVTIEAETDNTGEITVGGTGLVGKLADRTGITLDKGEKATLEVGDLAQVWLDTTVNGDGVTYVYGKA